MRIRNVIVGAGLAVALSAAIPAAAATITMDPTGSGGAGNETIDSFDLAFGNGIALGLTSASQPGDEGTFLFQANLNTGDLEGDTQFASCLGDWDCFTVVAAISEVITDNDGDGTLEFAFDPTGTNFFRIYATETEEGDNLTGDCFADGTGCLPKTLVLEGTFLNDGSFSSAFTHDGTPPVLLDQANDDDYDGVLSLGGNGSFQANIGNFTFINPLYFPDGLPATIFFDSSSQNSLPFDIVDPSACFSADGLTGGSTGAFAGTATPCANQEGVATVGAINAVSGPNTMLQNHAGLSFEAAAVPEPLTLSLLGLGLVGVVARMRRQRHGME